MNLTETTENRFSVSEEKAVRWPSLMDKKQVGELEKKYKGSGYEVETTLSPDDDTEIEVSLIFKNPTTASYDRYMKMISASSGKAIKTFVRDNIVEEQKDDLDNVTEMFPAVSVSAGEKLLYMLGLSKDATVKKL